MAPAMIARVALKAGMNQPDDDWVQRAALPRIAHARAHRYGDVAR